MVDFSLHYITLHCLCCCCRREVYVEEIRVEQVQNNNLLDEEDVKKETLISNGKVFRDTEIEANRSLLDQKL